MPDPLEPYRRKRNPRRTAEPVPPPGPVPRGNDDTFVIQEHHATRLHWDLRLERAGVLVSWAVPRGLPQGPGDNRLAVHTEDHPLQYATFSGEIPHGEYGGGRMTIWDRGTYETETWRDDEVKIVLHGDAVAGRYVLFRTGGTDWMVRRMSPPSDPDWSPLPAHLAPMLATAAVDLPRDNENWAYELKWDGVRAVVYVDGGRARVLSRNDHDVTGSYPELRATAAELGSRPVVLDGEIVALDEVGRPSFGRLQHRMHVTGAAQVRRAAAEFPATYLPFDVLHLDGHSTTALPYHRRRGLLESLDLRGPGASVPPAFRGDGAAVLAASREQGMEGVVAKRLDSPYLPGRRSEHWRKVKNVRIQAVVVAGWRPGTGRRSDTIGSLLVGVHSADGLVYAGHVGTGFSDSVLRELSARLRSLQRRTSPFRTPVPRPDAKDAHWVTPKLVGEVNYGEWTPDGRLRHPSWRGLRPDVDPATVRREP